VFPASALPDFLSYYNALAGRDPARVYMTGCDLDCDRRFRLGGGKTPERGISQLNMRFGARGTFTKWACLPCNPAAISARHWVGSDQPEVAAIGHLFIQHTRPAAFASGRSIYPVQRVGNTILLYWIPGDAVSPPSRATAELRSVGLTGRLNSRWRHFRQRRGQQTRWEANVLA